MKIVYLLNCSRSPTLSCSSLMAFSFPSRVEIFSWFSIYLTLSCSSRARTYSKETETNISIIKTKDTTAVTLVRLIIKYNTFLCDKSSLSVSICNASFSLSLFMLFICSSIALSFPSIFSSAFSRFSSTYLKNIRTVFANFTEKCLNHEL